MIVVKSKENVQPLKTDDEIKEFRQALQTGRNSERDLLLFNLGINTGLRMNELLQLKVEDVRGKTSLTIPGNKTQKKRQFFLHGVMYQIAEFVENKDDKDYLFASQRTNKPISTTQAYRILQKAADSIGRKDIGTHTLRKTFGYHYYKKTKDIKTLMEIFNHDSQNVTKKYIGIEEEITMSLQYFRL